MTTRRHILIALGAYLAGPMHPVNAQQRIARVGWLMTTTAGSFAEITSRGFIKGLAEAGYVEGKNLVLERRSADGDINRFPELARDLVKAQIEVFFAPAKPMADAAWYASRAIPTVIATVTDPIAVQYAKSLARPGLHITGVTTANVELIGKRLQMLTDLLPKIKRVAVLIDESLLRSCREEMKQADAAAAILGLTLIRVSASRREELEAAFVRAVRLKAQALMTLPMTSNHDWMQAVADQGVKHRMAVMHDVSIVVAGGGLISYGPDFEDIFRRAGHYVARILKGEKPAGMAIEEPREFVLSVNLKAAKALGITIPPTIMVLANRVIE